MNRRYMPINKYINHEDDNEEAKKKNAQQINRY